MTEQIRVELENKVKPLLRKMGYKLIKPIGSGGYASCYLIYDEEGKKSVCKILTVTKSKRMKLEQLKNSFLREKKSLNILKHRHIIQLEDYIEGGDLMLLIVKLCPNGSIQDLLDIGKVLSDTIVLEIIDAISSAMDYVHSFNICHHDLKPSNFFIDENHKIILGDFGTADSYMKEKKCYEKRGTVPFLAPEVFFKSDFDPFKVDVWAFGVSVFFMTYGFLPFGGNVDEMKTRFSKKLDLPEIEVNPMIKKIIEECLNYNPRERPSFREICSYLSNYNSNAQIKIKNNSTRVSKCNNHLVINMLSPKKPKSRMNIVLPNIKKNMFVKK